ncbi:uncharacterized protein ZBAI_03807 [Zygosaccharomyces bailii ISA1307]|nr:uncharacterized protein ZBAI_03807 [Zygosaccharomyces bailii ISA1307]
MWKNGKLFDQLAVPSSKQTPRQASAPFVKTEPTNVTFKTGQLQEHRLHPLILPRLHESSARAAPLALAPRPSGPSLVAGLELLATKQPHLLSRTNALFLHSLPSVPSACPFSPRPSSTGLLVTRR